MVKTGEGVLKGPEAICVDEKGRALYTATRDGWVKRLHPNGTWEDWRRTVGSSPTLLGITYSTLTNHVLACDVEKVGEISFLLWQCICSLYIFFFFFFVILISNRADLDGTQTSVSMMIFTRFKNIYIYIEYRVC